MSRKTLKNFLDQFPNDTKTWAEATDEVRDIARTAKEYFNEHEIDTAKPCNFKIMKTPSEWNTKGKQYIFDLYDKMSTSTRDMFDEYLKDTYNIKIK